MSQITNLAFFRARRGQSEALGAALAALVAPTRLEAGCLNYDLHRSFDDADVWFVYENWRSPEGFDAHMLSEHLQAFLKATPDLIAGNIDLRRFRMISIPATRRI
jgi:quinol monooxygenase YgiN